MNAKQEESPCICFVETQPTNRNVDCTGVATLKNASVNSAQCDGGFDVTGYHLDRDNKSWYSAFGSQW
jgi:hypothetical protein